ncbi:MAG: hypothetical protein ACFE7E_03975 [Candidatus Hodarchaeota archaeon]
MSDEFARKKITEFAKLFKDSLSMALTRFPDPLVQEVKPIEEQVQRFVDELTQAEKGLDLFKRWINARREANFNIKSLLDSLHKISLEEGDLSKRIELFIIPKFVETLKAIHRDRELCSKLIDFLPTVINISKGSSSTRERIGVCFEIIGYDKKKQTTEIESFFESLINKQPDDAERLLDSMKGHYEKLTKI